MEIRIGTITHDTEISSISLGDSITEEQHVTLLNSIAEIHHFENNKRLFEISFLNKNEFVDTLNRDTKEMIKSSLSISGDKKTYYKHHLNFNRLFINYLSSIKTFIDHTETNIKKKYGNQSKEYLEFEKMTNHYFDNFFSYRFLLKLRNYSQHCGLPLQEFALSVLRKSDSEYIGSSTIEFDPKKLLEDYSDWGRIVKEDLKNMKSNFPVGPLIEEMTNILLDIWLGVNYINEKEVLKAIENIKQTTAHLKVENAHICIFTNIKNNKDGSLLNFESLTIPYDFIDEFTSL